MINPKYLNVGQVSTRRWHMHVLRYRNPVGTHTRMEIYRVNHSQNQRCVSLSDCIIPVVNKLSTADFSLAIIRGTQSQ
jgi:UDP-glucose 4-epimerase